jgi:hypothetical protein
MDRVGIAPLVKTFDVPATNNWLRIMTQRMNVYSGANDPTAAEVPEGQWVLYHNTTSGEVRVWTNIAGAMKKSAAFT